MISPLLPASDDENDSSTKQLDDGDVDRGASSKSSSSISNENKNKNYFPDPDILDPTPLETARWWAEFTSIHGLYYALERGHFRPWKTIAWTALVTIAATGLIVSLVEEFRDFREYRVDATTRTVVPSSMEFPRVTICNASGGRDARRMNDTGIQEPRNEGELLAISQTLEEFVIHTEFNRRVLETEAAWTPKITPSGLCFTFATDERVFVPGLEAGLVVWAWLDQDSYPDGTEMAGVHVHVDPRDDFDFYNNDGKVAHQSSGTVVVPPGAMSYVAVTRQDYQREEDEPWTDCVPAAADNGENYSIERCRAECVMSVARDKCGCRLAGDHDDHENENGEPSRSYDFCNSENLGCTASIAEEDLNRCKACSRPACRERAFSARYSAGRVSRNLAERVMASRNASRDETSDNLVSVHVNFDSIRYEATTESKSTSAWQLVSNLGGNFGFFMGVSMISIVELFVELIGLRLVPMLWGQRRLYGIGQKKID